MTDWIFIDLDGTLLREDKTVSDYTVQTLQAVRRQGHRLVFATARPPRAVRRLLPAVFHDEYFLCGNGAKLLRGNDLLFDLTIPTAVVQAAIDVAKTVVPGLRFALEAGDQLTTNASFDDFGFGDPYVLKEGLGGPTRPCNKVLFAIDDPAHLAPLKARLSDDISVVETDGGKLLQIMPRGVTKGSGIRRLLELPPAFPGAATLCFGDDLNDAAMFRECSWPVAMGNAHPDLKPLAKAVAATNNDDGLARYLAARYLVEVRLFDAVTDDFLAVMAHLDAELAEKNGCLMQTYAGLNQPVGLARVAVAYDGDRPVACGAYKLHDDGRAEIKRMFVEPSHRGHGVSRRVLQALEASIVTEGCSTIVLETSRQFAEANGLYSRSGYRVIPNYPPYTDLEDSICYQKGLDAANTVAAPEGTHGGA